MGGVYDAFGNKYDNNMLIRYNELLKELQAILQKRKRTTINNQQSMILLISAHPGS